MRDRRQRPRVMLGAGAEVVAPDGRLLRLEQERLGVVEWSGPGGAVDPGEPITLCALRETLEETGLRVRLERLIRVTEFWEGEVFVGVGFLFLATPDPWPQEVVLPAVDGITTFRSYRWLTRDEAERLEPRWAHDVTRVAWPPDVLTPILDRVEATPGLRIRRARPEESTELSALAERSKAHWDYDADFVARVRAELTLRAEDIEAHDVWVLEDEPGAIVGFHRVIAGEPAILEDLWLDPTAIGAGLGRRLWEHAVAIARAGGASALELDAEPNAVGFYRRMGADVIGETPSSVVPGRKLPRMRIGLD